MHARMNEGMNERKEGRKEGMNECNARMKVCKNESMQE